MTDLLLGPVMLDLAGLAVTDEDRTRLHHPACGGVILFAKNYNSIDQLTELIQSIREVRPELLIAVDQEGGRVQRFHESFLRLPPLASLGQEYDRNPEQAAVDARHLGWLMAAECLAAGVDFSFAPVLDIDYGNSEVIGDRAFHSQPEVICELAEAYYQGMKKAGMAAVGKHFPGHGYVVADSHTEIPQDPRSLDEIEAADLAPFRCMIKAGIEGLMPAHVIYSACDAQPAGFSRFWLQTILREQLGFTGVIFSDDLSMAGAMVAGSPVDRARAALSAGCDMLLMCNDPEAADAVLQAVSGYDHSGSQSRLLQMRGNRHLDWAALHASELWQTVVSNTEEYLTT